MRRIVMAMMIAWLPFAAGAAEVDMEKSTFTWKASKVTGSFHTGHLFPSASSIQVKDGVIQSGELTLDMKTFTVTDIEGKWQQKFLTHIKSSDFLDVEKYPTCSLKILSVNKGQGVGELTVMGKTHRIVFSLKENEGKYVGKTTFDRTKFGMTHRSGNFFKDLGDKAIEDLIEVTFEVVLKQ